MVVRVSHRQKLMRSMAAHVVETTQHAVGIAHHQKALAAGDERALIAGISKLGCATDADPPGMKEMVQLPVQDAGARVRRSGERADEIAHGVTRPPPCASPPVCAG